jgi:hypothetical protein
MGKSELAERIAMKNVSNKVFLRSLRMIGACDEAVDWVKEHGGTTAELFRDCERGDWMNWYIVKCQDKLGVSKRQFVGALADIAALSLKYYEKQYPDDKRVRECIQMCRKYAKGKATDGELAAYADAAYAAANAAAYASANAAAYAASAAASAAAYAASAAYAAANAAYDAARMKTLKKCADIFRKHFPDLIEKGA